MALYYNTTKGLLSFSGKHSEYVFAPKAYTKVDESDQGHPQLLQMVRSTQLKRFNDPEDNTKVEEKSPDIKVEPTSNEELQDEDLIEEEMKETI